MSEFLNSVKVWSRTQIYCLVEKKLDIVASTLREGILGEYFDIKFEVRRVFGGGGGDFTGGEWQ